MIDIVADTDRDQSDAFVFCESGLRPRPRCSLRERHPLGHGHAIGQQNNHLIPVAVNENPAPSQPNRFSHRCSSIAKFQTVDLPTKPVAALCEFHLNCDKGTTPEPDETDVSIRADLVEESNGGFFRIPEFVAFPHAP